MNKSIDFELNKFPVIPHGLRENPSIDIADKSFIIDLARLYHHYYVDCYGSTPPNISIADLNI